MGLQEHRPALKSLLFALAIFSQPCPTGPCLRLPWWWQTWPAARELPGALGRGAELEGGWWCLFSTDSMDFSSMTLTQIKRQEMDSQVGGFPTLWETHLPRLEGGRAPNAVGVGSLPGCLAPGTSSSQGKPRA